MRQIALISVLLVGTGCQGLHDRIACRRSVCTTTEPCPEKKGAPEKPAAPRAPADVRMQPRQDAPAIAQDILLVPVTSYIPYARQTPVGPVRMAMPPQDIVPPRAPLDERAAPEDKTTIRKLMDLCEKQCERIDHLEKCLKERKVDPPTVICPPEMPPCRPPLLRRPLFPHLEPLFPRCEPLPQCEPVNEPALTPIPTMPKRLPSKSSSDAGPAVQPIE